MTNCILKTSEPIHFCRFRVHHDSKKTFAILNRFAPRRCMATTLRRPTARTTWQSAPYLAGSILNQHHYMCLGTRLASSIGAGYTSVRHSRNIAAVYDSEFIVFLGWIWFQHVSTFFPRKVLCVKNIWKSYLKIILCRSGRERGVFERGVAKSLALPVKISYVMLPMRNTESDDMEMVQWPYLAPHDFESWIKQTYIFSCFLQVLDRVRIFQLVRNITRHTLAGVHTDLWRVSELVRRFFRPGWVLEWHDWGFPATSSGWQRLPESCRMYFVLWLVKTLQYFSRQIIMMITFFGFRFLLFDQVMK